MSAEKDRVLAAVEARTITPTQGVFWLCAIHLARLQPWPLPPDDPFDVTDWIGVLTPEQQNALEALCTQ